MKKKTLLFVITLLLTAVVIFTAVFTVSGVSRKYIDKNTQITAAAVDLTKVFADTDSENVFKVKLNEMTDYFAENDINTVIIPFNEGKTAIADTGVFSKGIKTAGHIKDDILAQIKRSVEKSGVQIITEIDCTGLDKNEIVLSVNQIVSKYRTAGIMLKNADTSVFSNIASDMKKILKKYWLGVRLENIDAAQNIPDGTANLFVIDNISEKEYSEAKSASFADKKILLDYGSENFLSNMFVLANFGSFDGAVITEYTVPDTDLAFVNSMKDTTDELEIFEFEIDNFFAVTNPAKNTETTAQGIFVTGICDNTQPVYINGTLVNTAADGTFGHFIHLSEGENIIQVVQGNNTAARTVVRKTKEGSGNIKLKHDTTLKAGEGQAVESFSPLTSILLDPDDDSSIIDGVQLGVQLIVKDTVRTERDGQYTYAYRLSNDGYILAKNVVWIDEADYIPAKFNDIYIEKLENGDEYLNISLTGKPAVVSYFNSEKVTFEILNTEFADALHSDGMPYTINVDSVFGDECAVSAKNGNIYIEFENSGKELWGYNTEYCENDTVKIYLKRAPEKMTGEKPLTDVSIVVDAGHGGADPGALAVGGINGPNEADINLALAQAVKVCLEKLGATVIMTRNDDTYLTLQQRRDVVSEAKPDLFIAVHHNSLVYTADAREAKGFESYYFTPQSKNVAEKMAESVSYAAERENRGHYFGYYYVLRNDIAPGVLNEYGFMNNPYEYSDLHTNKEIYKAAMGTALAVLDIIPE